MKKLYFLGLISLWGSTLAGQVTLNWQVVDEQNRPLVGVSVHKKGTYEGVATDENGRFSMVINPGIDVLELSYLGYESLRVKTQKGMKLDGNEMLFSMPYNLDEITITGFFEKKEIINYDCCWKTICELINIVNVPNNITQANFSDSQRVVRVFPNPTQRDIFLQEETPLGQVVLYNLSGQKLQSFNFNEQLNASIDLGNLPSGTYFLRSSKGWTEKVILQRE